MNLIEVVCLGCGRTTAQHPEYPGVPRCLDCERAHHGLDDSKWFTPIGEWHPTIPRVRPGELRPIIAQQLEAPTPPPYVVIRPAAPYDLATPGTPQGLRQLAAAALEGGRFTASAALAVAISSADGSVVASLGLRMRGDEPGRPRRAWAVYVRREAEDGAVCWESAGAALLDAGAAPRVRPIGILELRCVLRGEVYVPPPQDPQSAGSLRCARASL
jgi:hypothetical protein